MITAREKRLILCLHDVSPCDFDRVREIDEFYQQFDVGADYAMLVVPDYQRRWYIEDFPAFISWLKRTRPRWCRDTAAWLLSSRYDTLRVARTCNEARLRAPWRRRVCRHYRV